MALALMKANFVSRNIDLFNDKSALCRSASLALSFVLFYIYGVRTTGVRVVGEICVIYNVL